MSREAKDFATLFQELAEEKNLNKIRRQVENGTREVTIHKGGKDVQTTRRGTSKIVLDLVGGLLQFSSYKSQAFDCKYAELPCMQAAIDIYFGKLSQAEAKKVVLAFNKLLPALYHKPNVMAHIFTDISKVMKEKQPALAEYISTHLVIPPEIKALRKTGYAQKVLSYHREQKEVTDTEILEIINNLRKKIELKQADIFDRIAFVAVTVGSRMIEILKVSEYDTKTPDDNPYWLTVKGVAKDPNDKEGADSDVKRVIVKPVIMVG